ncbi:flagellar basal body rod protein FlgB [Pseudoneobacillus rhizosphaerae]|uniref:Flagellar basal body rod protein FlgB n=1 Tax=Pseudoneobacillus rhizosphaerae TaxID=2880968 RepID=A0A9C7GC37_9BACI|nr:flagellar basal body rod protein FlgB [Pseudoneobacillus rhizosphaerae]CAG9609779.1 Flagellar basal body rod protein FlgB [Pseudoneobacillus rhizosphaerae]
MSQISILHTALNASNLRQDVISNNIANAETPGYKSKQVVFENILKQQLSNQTNFKGTRTDSRHFNIGLPSNLPQPEVVELTETKIQNSGNNVDIEEEMTRLSKNALWYYTLTQQLNSEFQKLSIAIKGRV